MWTAGVEVLGFDIGGGRMSPPPISGAGPKNTVITNAQTGYAFSYPDSFDFAILRDLQILQTSPAGGGVDFSLGMGQADIERVEFNGMAASKYAVNCTHANGAFMIGIRHGRFWSQTGTFLGGILKIADPSEALSLSLNTFFEHNFCTHLDKNGNAIELHNATGAYFGHNQFECTAASITNQAFVSLSGTGFTPQFRGDYIEQPWKCYVKVTSGSEYRAGSITDLFCRQPSNGSADCKILDLSGGIGNAGWKVDRVIFSSSVVTAGTAFLIDDPWHNVEIGYVQNISGGNQANRLVSQLFVAKADGAYANSHLGSALPAMREAAGQAFKADAGLGALACTIEVPLLTDVENWKDGAVLDATKVISGVYRLTATCMVSGGGSNGHSVTGSWRLKYNRARSYNVANKIDTDDSDGANAPTALTAAVSNNGVLTLSATQAISANHLFR
jgi:hypothetical protein